jgi:GT2 family glycosyltransferase
MIDILVVTHRNSDDQIISCIQSVLTAKNNISDLKDTSNIRIYVGNSSENKFSEDLSLFLEKSGVKFIDFGSNIYHSSGINKLSKTATNKFLFILNPDTVVNPSIFLRFVEFIETNKNIKVVECRQLPYDHPKVYNASTLLTPWITGAAFFIEKKLFDEIGGFDKILFPMYCNDVDLSLRLRNQGIQLFFNPELIVFHRKRVNHNGDLIISDFEKFDSRVSKIVLLYKYGQFTQYLKELNSLDLTNVINLRVKAEVEIRITGVKSFPKVELRKDLDLEHFFQNPQFAERRFK